MTEVERIARFMTGLPVTATIKEVVDEVCRNYCKWPVIYEPTKIGDIDDDYMGRMLEEKCKTCPLKRLM